MRKTDYTSIRIRQIGHTRQIEFIEGMITKIEAERLNIIALTPEQLELWTHSIGELERELLCSYRAEPMEDPFREIVCGQVERAKKDPDNYL